VVKDFKHWPPYRSLGENCLTNGTLPSLAFGFKACSLKWKVYPQDQFCNRWGPAMRCWKRGGKVRKVIGYDAGAKDRQAVRPGGRRRGPEVRLLVSRSSTGSGTASAARRRSWPPGCRCPVKSACYFCPATQPEELHELKKVYLRYIVIMEARAEPRLEKIEGLWRNGVKGTRGGKKKPGKMTDYIREHGLLPADEIDALGPKRRRRWRVPLPLAGTNED
jgi:hypothetical protein